MNNLGNTSLDLRSFLWGTTVGSGLTTLVAWLALIYARKVYGF